MKKHSQRAQRVGDQIQRELAPLLREGIKDPRVGPVTVTSVEVSADLSHAKIFFSHLAGSERRDEAVAVLQHTAGYLRRELSRRLQLYSVPQLHFVYDDSIESGMRLSQLIDSAVAADAAHHNDDDAMASDPANRNDDDLAPSRGNDDDAASSHGKPPG